MSSWIDRFDATSVKHLNKDESFKLQYGTAGFRSKASILDHVFYRMGILASLRSMCKKGQSIGLMITASHNPEDDNGIKLIDPTGEMLEQSWEKIATELVQCSNDEVKNYIEKKRKDLDPSELEPVVFVGHDTRPSCKPLLESTIHGLSVFSTKVVNFNIVTTPMLHFFVYKHNVENKLLVADDYFVFYANAFLHHKKYINTEQLKNYSKEIYFDGANGVGSLCIENLIRKLNNELNIKIFNKDVTTKGKLNYQCGADFIKTKKTIPAGFEENIQENNKYVSVDGDADRIIYWYVEHNIMHLLDGDRIGVLFALYINQLIQKTKLNDQIEIKVIQTAYTNGNCTKYVRDQLNIDVIFASTGVKYLHHEALKYDIGIYFEANGHGTVLYSEKLKAILKENKNSENFEEFVNFILLTNETVGDSFSIMLLIETILHATDMSLQEWYALYQDLPNQLSTAKVKDRTLIRTVNADTQIVSPVGMQKDIDDIVSKYENGRSFVRASGTEDIVRIYAEAQNENEVSLLTEEVKRVIEKYL